MRSRLFYTPVSRDSDVFRRLVVKFGVLSDSFFFLFIYFSYSHCTFEHYQASSRHLRGLKTPLSNKPSNMKRI